MTLYNRRNLWINLPYLVILYMLYSFPARAGNVLPPRMAMSYSEMLNIA